jgi:hypothetical protein
VRVPTADETADAIAGAHQALAEIEARDVYDAQQSAEEAARTHRSADLDLTDYDAVERA